MKTLLKKLIAASLSSSGIAVAALLAGGSVQTSQAASADPSQGGTYTWDVVSKGSGQRGISLITFSNDMTTGNSGTFRGYQMLAALPPNNPSTGARGGSTDGRGGSSSGSGKTNDFFFGFSPINGVWTLNSKGQIVGFFIEALNVTSTVTNFHATAVFENIVNGQTLDNTNIFISFTNGQASVTTNFAWATPDGYTQLYTFDNPDATVDVGSAQTTNTVSFTGTASGGKRLTLLCNTSFGKVAYKGVQAVPNLDLSGNWVGSKREGGQQFNELFRLVSFAQDNPFPAEFPDIANFPNLFFTTNGVGPGYGFTGVVIFSHQKMVGFTFTRNDGTVRSTIGTLKATKHGPSANTDGIEEPVSRVNFSATLQ